MTNARHDGSFGSAEWIAAGCCFWEKQREGEALKIYIECDDETDTCKEVIASNVPKTRRPNVGTGTLSGQAGGKLNRFQAVTGLKFRRVE